MSPISPELLALLDTSFREAVSVLRLMLRSQKETMRRDAAKLLISAAEKALSADTDGVSQESILLAQHVLSLNERELELWAREPSPPGLGSAGSKDSSGPD